MGSNDNITLVVTSNTTWRITYEGKGWSCAAMSGNDAIISGNYEFNFQNNKILGDWETLFISLECDDLSIHDYINVGA